MLRAAPVAHGIQDPRLGWRQRLRGFARGLLIDRVCGRIGLRAVGLPRRVLVFAETVDCLRDGLEGCTARACRVTLVVAWWRAPWPGWSGRVGPLPALVHQRVRLPRYGRGAATVDIRASEPVAVRDALAAALHALRPARSLPGPPAAVHAQPARLLPGPPAAVHAQPARPLPGPPTAVHAQPAGPIPVLVDAQRVNPRGRMPESYRGDAPTLGLELSPSRPPWRWPGAAHWRRGEGAELAWPTIAALRSVGIVRCPTVPGEDAAAEASLLVQLAMTGVVLYAPHLPPCVADLLSAQLRAILGEPLFDEGPLGREIRSVRQRRVAIRTHSTRFATASAPSVSAILATKRASHLPSILRAVVAQTYPNLEIVLCLHGIGLPDECAALLADCGRPVQVVPVPADVPFGTALGWATARASGSLVTKVDDDDTYGPEHVWDLVLARHYSGATLVGKGIEFVYLESADATVRRRSGRPESEDSVVAGGTMLIGRGELEELGGWRPVPRSVDRGLLDRLARAGAVTYRTHPLGYIYHRRGVGHTWAATDDFFLRLPRQRWAGLLDLPEFSGRGPAGRSAR
jgi:hypothetical protein